MTDVQPPTNNNKRKRATLATEGAEDSDSATTPLMPAKIARKTATTMKLVERCLFDGTENLAHCISQDCKMGAGIAAQFVKRFGPKTMRTTLQQAVANRKIPVGGVVVYMYGDRYIYNLVTKQAYWEKPTYATLEASLVAMREHALEHDVETIALPYKMACGLDRLEWVDVAALLAKVFAPQYGVSLLVCKQ